MASLCSPHHHYHPCRQRKKCHRNESLDFDLDEFLFHLTLDAFHLNSVLCLSVYVCLHDAHCVRHVYVYFRWNFGGCCIMDKYLHFTLKDKYFRPANLTSHQLLGRHTTRTSTCTIERTITLPLQMLMLAHATHQFTANVVICEVRSFSCNNTKLNRFHCC